MKTKLFFILSLGCAAMTLSCSKEQNQQENDQQTAVAATAPSSLDGIWQKTYPIGTKNQNAGDLSIVATIEGSVATMTISSDEGKASAEGSVSYNPSEGTGQIDLAQFKGAGVPAVTKVEIIQAFDGEKLGGKGNGAGDVAFSESSSLFGAVVTLADGTRDSCMFLQISPLPAQTKASTSELFGPVGGVKELVCSDGSTVITCTWMSNLSDDVLLRRLTIPGTHDAATASIPLTVLGKDQMYDLDEQLDMGVRYFDLRVDEDGRITHGGVYTDYTFRGAMNEMTQWLNEHPSEGILAEIRWEKNQVAYTAYAIALKAQIAAIKLYNSTIGYLFPEKKKTVPDRQKELDEWVADSKASYFKKVSSILEGYKDWIVSIDNNLTLGQLRGKISFYDCDDNNLIDVSGHTEQGAYPDSHGMYSDEEFQARIAGVLKSMEDFTTTAQTDEFFGKVCTAGYIEPWFTEGQIPFAKEMAPQVIAKSDELLEADKSIHAIVMMDYAPLQLNGQGSSFLDNLILMNF